MASLHQPDLVGRSGEPTRSISHSSTDAAGLAHPPAHVLAEIFDVARARSTTIDEEIAMHFAHLRIAEDKAAAAGRIDELPGLAPGRDS